VKTTVKSKEKKIKSENPDEGKHAQIVRTRSGCYQLLLPTKLNEELEPFVGEDFDMNVVEEGETLRVILTKTKDSKET
jgi:hypothetical protein